MNDRRQALEQLAGASPLEITQKLEEFEHYDRKSSQAIIDEVTEEFQSGEHMADSVIKPVFLSVLDSLLEIPPFRKARKKGLTASRVFTECEQFSYSTPSTDNDSNNGYNDYKNADEYLDSYGEANRKKFIRSKYENKNAMDKYKENQLKDEDGNLKKTKLIEDEYAGEKNLYVYRNDPDKRRNDPGNYQAETDHIVPLKQLHNQFKGNYALSDHDIKMIANSDYNLAVTSRKINRTKSDQTNSEYLKTLKGEQYDTLRSNMRSKEKEATNEINKNVNKTVLNNLTGKGNISDQEFKDKYGRSTKKEDKQGQLYKDLQKEKMHDIHKQNMKNAADQAKENAVGNLILFIIKPIYFEMKDCFKNGIVEGVGASSTLEAFKIRFGRVKDYVLQNALAFIGDNVWEFIKGFISSLIEGIISLFVGIFKQVLKVIKEGIKLFVQSAKILFGKESRHMTPSQKGDAIIKILGGSVIALAGIGIDMLLNKLGVPESVSLVLSALLSGIASTIFMYLLDKMDLFSVKAEKRRDRLVDIFNERIQEIQAATNDFDAVAIETLRKQHQQFEDIKGSIQEGLDHDDLDSVNASLYKMADFFKVDLPYKNTSEFVDFFDSQDVIKL
jgi:hypothetical protein